jgi:putative restriction endonuclease
VEAFLHQRFGRSSSSVSSDKVTEDRDPWTPARETDQRVRIAAFDFLRRETELRGEVLPRRVLAEGFQFEGQRVPLIGPQGIFKPAILPEMPLTITTVPVVEGRERPYEDQMDENGLLLYRYRGTDPGHRDNAGLRLAMRRAVPLIYLFGVVPGEYMPVWPVFIVRDDPASLAFSVAVDLKDTKVTETPDFVSNIATARRAYVTRLTQQRLHQAGFRARVIRAYQEHCAVCHLRHFELLDAAHILPDKHPKGDPVVSNGLALCKLHHAAFDGHILGVRPDLIVEIREDILREQDGPMLIHGLQGFQGARILIPTRPDLQPDRDFLAERYEIFRNAG